MSTILRLELLLNILSSEISNNLLQILTAFLKTWGKYFDPLVYAYILTILLNYSSISHSYSTTIPEIILLTS